MITWWFEIVDEDSDLCGEQFFVEVDRCEDDPRAIAIDLAGELFGDVEMECLGRVSAFEAEMMGLDTY